MRTLLHRFAAVAAAMLLLSLSVPVVAAYHEEDGEEHVFANADFWETWARTDLPVSNLDVERTWMWGPSPFTEGMTEDYADSPGGTRQVQYFDKSRMEINDAEAEDDDLWYVTNGLLVVEMVNGTVQVGDDEWLGAAEGWAPAEQNIAGDPGEHPTYADIHELALMDEPATDEGTTIVATFEDDLTIGEDETYANAGVTAEVHVPETDHTVASVFWDFMTSTGLVFVQDEADEDTMNENGELVTDELFENPFYATGYPITEAYWSTVMVDGTERDVLWQCFERRCLTFTPTNEPTWQVEAGNVGQHYYRWRYIDGPGEPPGDDFDVVASGLNNPRGIDSGDDGSVYVAVAGPGGEDCFTVGTGEEVMEFCAGTSGEVVQVMGDAATPVLTGLPSLLVDGAESLGAQDVVVAGDTIYAVVGWGFALTLEQRAALGDEGAAFGTLVASTGDGNWEIVADLLAYEAANNPDGGAIDSNPFSLAMVEDGFVVSDAGANALLHVTMDGTISTVAVFPDEMVEFPPGTPMPMQAVPTSVTVGPDGAYYVGQLTGFPFIPGAADVWRVMDENGDGDALDDGEVEVYASGFTNIIGVEFDGAGNLYVLEMVAGGLLNANPEDPASLAAALTQVAPDGTETEIPSSGLLFATGLGITADGEIYVSNMGVMGPMGQLVRMHHQAEGELEA